MHRLLLLAVMATVATSHPTDPTSSSSNVTESVRHPQDNLIIASDAAKESHAVPLPEPVNITFDLDHKPDDDRKPNQETEAAVRVQIDHDGVPVVHGIRLPDDPNDKTIWRNARVLNNKLVTDNVKDLGDMFIYRPDTARALNEDQRSSFKPSQTDDTFTPSLPYPVFYYSNYYNDKNDASPLPDTIGLESAPQEEPTDADARGKILFAEDPRPSSSQSEPIPIPTGKLANLTQPPAYFVPSAEASSIHDDHSPYDFEPTVPSTYYADEANPKAQATQEYQYYQPNPIQTAQQVQQQQQYQYYVPQRSGQYQPEYFQTPEGYVIQQQTYKTGDGSVFSVPIPIQGPQQPQYQYQYQLQQRPPLRQRPTTDYGALLREQWTKGIEKLHEKIHDVTSPVMDPLAEAGQKISTNLGIPERVQKINEKVATPSVIVPLAMAGGAALALGTLSTAAALKNNREETLSKLGIGQLDAVLKKIEAKVTERKESDKKEADKKSTDATTKNKRSADLDHLLDQQNLLDDILSGLNGPQRSFLSHLQRMGFDQWRQAGCAKRIFCDVMTQQSDDAIALMEKRMSTFLSLLDDGLSANLQELTSDVMDGIRRRNCLPFVCSQSLNDSPSLFDEATQ